MLATHGTYFTSSVIQHLVLHSYTYASLMFSQIIPSSSKRHVLHLIYMFMEKLDLDLSKFVKRLFISDEKFSEIKRKHISISTKTNCTTNIANYAPLSLYR